MNRISLIILLVCWMGFFSVRGQELNCTVKINSDQVEGTNKQVFATLERSLSEMVNTRKWTELSFSGIEKIDCTFQLTIKKVTDQTRYSAELIVQSRRPVFNAAYTTALMNFKDTEVEFNYQENEPLVYNEQTIENNLVAVFTYYIYMILGVDSDSFAPLGGSPYFRRAEQIVTQAQSSSEKGWRAFDNNRNRYALVTALLQESLMPYRRFWYDYHRKGLDDLALNVDKGRAQITRSMKALTEIRERQPQSVLLSLFIDTKLDELVNLYSKTNQTEKENVYKLLMNIYPAYGSRLADLRKE